MFKLTVVTPERRLVVDQEISEVTVPGFRGELNILPGHAPLITVLETGIMKWKLANSAEQSEAVVSWGYCEVHPTGVNVLADIADLPGEINVAEANQIIEKAQKRLLNESLDDEAWKDVHREIARAQADIQIAGQ